MAETPPPVDTHIPKDPNFGIVVAAAVVVLFVLLLVGYLLLRREGGRFMLHPHTQSGSALMLTYPAVQHLPSLSRRLR